MKNLNNKGFTLVEVLAVLVILVVIMSIAVPNISSSLERSKAKQDDARKEVLKSYAELYIVDYKNSITTSEPCYITLNELVNGGYASEDEIKDSDGNVFTEVIIFTRSTNSYEFGTMTGEQCLTGINLLG